MYGLIRMSEVFEQKRAANSERKYLWGRGGGAVVISELKFYIPFFVMNLSHSHCIIYYEIGTKYKI